jgi:hypothetical protein
LLCLCIEWATSLCHSSTVNRQVAHQWLSTHVTIKRRIPKEYNLHRKRRDNFKSVSSFHKAKTIPRNIPVRQWLLTSVASERFHL